MEFWEEGLERRGESDPGWIGFLEEEVPDQVVRAVSVEAGDEASYWPSLRALLVRCTRWFGGKDEAPEISPFLEQHLAKKVTPAFLGKFLPELTGKGHAEEFHNALLALLRHINGELAPLDPLRTLEQMRHQRGPSRHIDFLVARYRAIPYPGRRENIGQLWE